MSSQLRAQVLPQGYGLINQAVPYGYGAHYQSSPQGYGPINQAVPYGYGAHYQAAPQDNGSINQAVPYGYGAHNQAAPQGYGTNTQVTPNGTSFNQIMPQTMIGSIINQPISYRQEPRPPSNAHVQSFPRINMRIDCGDCIRHSDISSFIRNNHLNDRDRRVVQGNFTLLNNESEWVMRNAEIEDHGENITVTFFAGGAANKYVVHLDENDKVASSCQAKGLRLFLRDAAVSIWNVIKSVGSTIVGALPGAIRPMLTAGN